MAALTRAVDAGRSQATVVAREQVEISALTGRRDQALAAAQQAQAGQTAWRGQAIRERARALASGRRARAIEKARGPTQERGAPETAGTEVLSQSCRH
jgi:hypothetical protein